MGASCESGHQIPIKNSISSHKNRKQTKKLKNEIKTEKKLLFLHWNEITYKSQIEKCFKQKKYAFKQNAVFVYTCLHLKNECMQIFLKEKEI